MSSAATYLVLALACGALTALVAAAPGDVMQAAAGLALLGTLAPRWPGRSPTRTAARRPSSASWSPPRAISILGVGAAFWALVAGLVLRPLLRSGVRT